MNDKGVHETHCCKIHGCKYSDNDCPVAYGDSPGNEACEYCAMDMELDGHMGSPKTNDINELRLLLSDAEERCKSLGGEVNHYSALCGKYKGRAEAAEARLEEVCEALGRAICAHKGSDPDAEDYKGRKQWEEEADNALSQQDGKEQP